MNLGRRRGIVLVIVLGLVLLFVITATSFMLISNSEIKMVRKQNDSTKAFYLAEAGLEHVRVQLDQDWTDQSTISSTLLGDGNYSVNISIKDSGGVDLPTDELRIESTGNVGGASRAIEAILRTVAGDGGANVDSPIETEGSLTITGSADINPEGGEETGVDLSFETIFGMTKEEMEAIAQNNFPDTYYNEADEIPFDNDIATGLTWVSSPATQSQITTQHADGDRDGILIVDGDMKITGGIFNGVIWIIGSLTISGNPTISGGIFVESGATVDTSVSGNATINFSANAVGNAFDISLGSLSPIIQSWQEVSN